MRWWFAFAARHADADRYARGVAALRPPLIALAAA